MQKLIPKSLFFLNLLLWFACSTSDSQPDGEKPLVIFAAASLTNVLPETASAFQAQHPVAKIDFNFAASSTLAKQIEHGAGADIYFSANAQWVEYLEKKNFIREGSRIDFFSNKLVLIIHQNRENPGITIADLETAAVKSIALGDWSHVPAGVYAKSALEKFGIWENVHQKCIPAMDVRAALTYVERGEADCAIVYRTDAAISKKVVIASELPEEIQPEIRYPVVITRRSNHPLGDAFLTFLGTQTASRIFEKHGFVVLKDEGKRIKD